LNTAFKLANITWGKLEKLFLLLCSCNKYFR